ncbi:MAG: hypothetical protein EXS11_03680 [Gemmataceae bacterium]|nr:hypothetical protein [Gemmataceae bacterium]
MLRFGTLALLLSILSVTLLVSAETNTKNLQGAWVKEINDFKIELDFKGNKLNITLTKGENKVQLDTDYSAGRDKTVFGRIVSIKEDGIQPATEKGDLFSLAIEVEEGKIVVKELKGTKTSDDAKKLIEGDYKKK